MFAKQFIGIRFDATGIFGYSFQEEGTKVFNVSIPVMPNPDIHLLGFGTELWHRNYDGRVTLFPGSRRDIVDEAGVLQGFHQYVDHNKFEIFIEKEARASVMIFDNGWHVAVEDAVVATIIRMPENEKYRFTEDGLNMDKRFRVNINEDVDLSLYPYIMAIPMLGF